MKKDEILLKLQDFAENLATVVRGWVNKKELSKHIGLKDHQYITFCQTIGYATK